MAEQHFQPPPALSAAVPNSIVPNSSESNLPPREPQVGAGPLTPSQAPVPSVPGLSAPPHVAQTAAFRPYETSSYVQNGYSGPSPASSANGGATVASYLGDSGYLSIFRGDGVAADPPEPAVDSPAPHTDLPPPALQESYLETYFRRCYAWCPIIDRNAAGDVPSASESALVQYGIALIGSHIEPPVRQHAEPIVYYERAKTLFYANQEKNPLLAISGIMLFYWWGSSPPDVVSMDTVWWWTGVAIRQAQQLGLHRESRPGQTPLAAGESPSLKRRIWWTLFVGLTLPSPNPSSVLTDLQLDQARERLTSICMGRPCMIDPDDCNVAELTIDDFPSDQAEHAEVFVYWVRLCAIVGNVGKHLLRKTESTPFPIHLASQLKQWMASLPSRLHLPIHGPRTTQFDPHVHQLHLTYLTTVTLLYLSGNSTFLPRAYATAVLASCCVARIFEDYTARGSLRFLHGISGWSIAIAILALMHARKVSRLAPEANAHIAVLRIALKELARMWHSARMFDRGMERIDTDTTASLLSDLRNGTRDPGATTGYLEPAPQSPMSELSGAGDGGDGIEWPGFFPFLTAETSPLAAILLDPTPTMQLADVAWPADFTMQLHGFFEPGDLNFPMFVD